MKKYFDKRLMGVFLMIFVFFTAACEAEAAKSLRQKSSVLLVFNNIAGTRYDEKLTQIALEKLQKKIEGIYLEIDAEPYGENFKEKSFEKASFAELMVAGQIILFIPSCSLLQKKHILILYILIKMWRPGWFCGSWI